MKFARRYTHYVDEKNWTTDSFALPIAMGEFSAVVRDAAGGVIRSQEVTAPQFWPKQAVDVLADKYFRRAGVPSKTVECEPIDLSEFSGTADKSFWSDVPVWIRPRRPAPGCEFGSESSVLKTIQRIVGHWCFWGWCNSYFDSEADARAFHDEVAFMIINQMFAPNSPQWFNVGLWWAYGITGDPYGMYTFAADGQGDLFVEKCKDRYSRPEVSACFIQSVSDSLCDKGGIMDLWLRESKVYKSGAGSGTNFSRLRARNEPLSAGGFSSGLMSWLHIGDATAGAIKSGGTTRRASKMIFLNDDHPDVYDFVVWKAKEEQKVGLLLAGQRAWERLSNEAELLPTGSPAIDRLVDRAIEEGFEVGTAVRLRSDVPDFCPKMDSDYRGEAYQTVDGQNSNNSVMMSRKFIEAVRSGGSWSTHWRTDPTKTDTRPARELWGYITEAAWACADPGAGYRDTINSWHTCPGTNEQPTPIDASNPCVTGDTLIATSDGWRRIDSLLEVNSEILGSDGKLHSIRPAFSTGKKAVYRLRTRSGYELKLTADHRVSTRRGDVAADELKPGDRIMIAGDAVTLQTALPEIRIEHRPSDEIMSDCDEFESLEFVGVEAVYDLTEPETNHFVANGLVVHNCGEYLFIDDTACDLGSLNLAKFFRADGSFDFDSYRHACRLGTIVLDISLGLGSYPSEDMAFNTGTYRTIGLGYANLGAVTMVIGFAYGSEASLSFAACLTAIMQGEAMSASAEIAESLGCYPGFAANKDAHLRVMRAHRNAFGRNIDSGVEVDLPGDPPLPPPTYSRELDFEYYRQADASIRKGFDNQSAHGSRNAQLSVIAPTGTIGLVMSCDTTGAEPDFSLIKWKSLAGGGYMRIVNQSVEPALHRLGYTKEQVADAIHHLLGPGKFTWETELQKRLMLLLSDESVIKLSESVPPVKSMQSIVEIARVADAAKFTDDEWERLDIEILGYRNLESWPKLKPEHVAVFDCAAPCGAGERSIPWQNHIKVVAAIQPYISGAISKTINMPNSATVQDVSDALMMAHDYGMKDVTVYRDNSKLSQPLTHARRDKSQKTDGTKPAKPLHAEVRRPREYLPSRRYGWIQNVRFGGYSLYLRTGEYPDGRLGEIFIDLKKQASTLGAMCNAFSIAVSLGLQHGVPLEEFVDAFIFTRFEPNGPVSGSADVKMCNSPVDYIFRELAISYLGRRDLSHVDHTEGEVVPLPPSKSRPPAPLPRTDEREFAISAGYTGFECTHCLSFRTVRSGPCLRCEDCGSTTGCS